MHLHRDCTYRFVLLLFPRIRCAFQHTLNHQSWRWCDAVCSLRLPSVEFVSKKPPNLAFSCVRVLPWSFALSSGWSCKCIILSNRHYFGEFPATKEPLLWLCKHTCSTRQRFYQWQG
uniref:Putative secreted protein n=1 Tax=Anopheles darlingi TaxID=43151 RepID=A0A2M4D2L2_ANODA